MARHERSQDSSEPETEPEPEPETETESERWQDLEERSLSRLKREDRDAYERAPGLFPVRGRPRREGAEPGRADGGEPLSAAERQARSKARHRLLEAMALEAGYDWPADLAAALLREPGNRARVREVPALASRPGLLAAAGEGRVSARDLGDAAQAVLRAAYRRWTLPPPGAPAPAAAASGGGRRWLAFTPLGSLPPDVGMPAGSHVMLIVQPVDESNEPFGRRGDPADFDYLVRLEAERLGCQPLVPRPASGGFIAVCPGIERAVAAARAVRADLTGLSSPLHFRMALHAGPLVSALGGFPSRDVHLCEALLLIAGRDRVVLTSAAHRLLERSMSLALGARPWGPRVLAILQEDDVYELDGPSGPPPPQVPLLGTFERLPPVPFPMADLVSSGLEAIGSGARLVTFYGPGGAGATRVALQVAVAAAGRFPDGVYGVDLAAIVDRGQVARVVAGVLQVSAPGKDSIGPLVDHLRDRRVLLVLDSCDRALTECQQLLEALLQRCPGLAVVATSLEPLSLPQERSFNLRPLSLPSGQPGSTRLVDIDSSEAGRLFTDRVRELNGDYRFTEADAGAVAEVCHLVQGLPLAIELIAAMTASQPTRPVALARDLREYVEQQTGVPAPALPRERLLHLAISWRLRNLRPQLVRTVLRLSLFPADFDAAAAAAVCGAGGRPGRAVPLQQKLDELVRQGFVRSIDGPYAGTADRAGGPGRGRYRIHESVRLECDALRRYDESLAPEVEVARARFADHFARLLAGAVNDVDAPGQSRWIDYLRGEIPSFRAALLWSRSHPDRMATWATLAGAFARFLLQVGQFEEAGRIVDDGLERWTEPDATRQTLLSHAGLVAWRRGAVEEAERRWTEAAAVAGVVGDGEGRARALDQLGMVALSRGDHELAVRRCEEGLSVALAAGSSPRAAFCLFHLGLVAVRRGEAEAARAHLEESLRLRLVASPPNPDRVAATHLGLAELAIGRRDLAAAGSHLGEALATYVAGRNRIGIASALSMCAVLAAAEPDPDCAVLLSTAAGRILAETGRALSPIWEPTVRAALASARARLAQRYVELAEERGRAMDDQAAVDYAVERLASAS